MGDRAVELYRKLGNAGKVAFVLGCSRNAVMRMLRDRGVTCAARVSVVTHEGSGPVIQWVKDRHGIWRGVVENEPHPDAPGGVTAAEQPSNYDEARIRRRMLGDRSIHLHKGEPAEVVRRLLEKRWTANEIRRRTGIKPERYIRQIELERAA